MNKYEICTKSASNEKINTGVGTISLTGNDNIIGDKSKSIKIDELLNTRSTKQVKRVISKVAKPIQTILDVANCISKSMIYENYQMLINIEFILFYLGSKYPVLHEIINNGIKYRLIKSEDVLINENGEFEKIHARYAPYLINSLFKNARESLRYELLYYFDNKWLEDQYYCNIDDFYYGIPIEKVILEKYHD